MELLNVGRQGKDRYKKLEHGLQHMRPKVSSQARPFHSPFIGMYRYMQGASYAGFMAADAYCQIVYTQ